MQQILDLHIHSKYSRACSKQLVLENIDKVCRIKGINIIATGDFTHPEWFRQIKTELKEVGNSGLYQHNGAPDDKIKFILSTEVSLIYKQGDKCRRIHVVIHAPNIKAAAELIANLEKRGVNLKSDGRPIFGMSAPDLVKLCLNIHPQFLIYPAHIWTPWFSVFGSKSGFNTLEECFGDQTEHIYAYETGLSSDPEMNWRVSALDNLTLLSNSDAHSPANLAREANVFDLIDVTYDEIYQAVRIKDLNKIKYSIEFYPEEGMYHYDGHRTCNISFTPEETKKQRGLCPVCKKPLIIGVMNRVEELADRPLGYQDPKFPSFKKLVELDKIIAEALGVSTRTSKKVQAEYNNIIKEVGNELYILMQADLKKIEQTSGGRISEGIRRVREGELDIKPGFDGQYGVIRIFGEIEKGGQGKLEF